MSETKELDLHVMDENIFQWVLGIAGTVITTLGTLFLKSMRDRIAEKDRQIKELKSDNERINSELVELYKELIALAKLAKQGTDD